jgi:UDP-N-acetylmuramoyl-L-alanyl-D-glutamate--2,6-diaminopimelate ligase
LTFGLHPEADVRAESIKTSLQGNEFTLIAIQESCRISSPLCGRHNISNCLAAAATALALGIPLATIHRGIESLAAVPGRLERVEAPTTTSLYTVFVDYAHTHDALQNVLQTLRPLTQGQLITVFGCGGNRDAGKRPLMGRVASELSDFSIITTDNPRSEEPDKIAREIATGFGQHKNFHIVLDRRQAIHHALGMAKPHDVILLAGKGHETYQETRGIRSPFDDRTVAREEMLALARACESTCTHGEQPWKN